jgi:sugar diacid utilization regulator
VMLRDSTGCTSQNGERRIVTPSISTFRQDWVSMNAAREVYCHRHTLRYRMRRVEELTGRDLSRAHDRIEFWLALRARELVE